MWSLPRRVVGHILRATVHTIRDQVESADQRPGARDLPVCLEHATFLCAWSTRPSSVPGARDLPV
jgi:hypothetical protein